VKYSNFDTRSLRINRAISKSMNNGIRPSDRRGRGFQHAPRCERKNENFLVRPHRKLVEQYAQWPAPSSLTPEAAGDVAEHLAGLPSTVKDDDEDAKRFDMLILRRQLAQLEGDAVAAERLRGQVQ
jgi:type I site-specific restriction endonuclease